MRVQMDRQGLRDVKYKVRGIARRSENLTPVWPRLGSFLAQANRRQFTSHGAYYGTPWAPLKPDYAQWKLRNGYGRKTLVLSGGMKASFTSRPMAIEKYYKQSATYGSDHWLAKFHQYGTHRNGKQANPPRPMMVKNRAVVKAARDMIDSYVKTGKISAVRGYL